MELPIEIKAEILKSFPIQRRIAKSLNQYNKQLFSDQFAALPISQYEILKYVQDHDIILFVNTINNGLPFLSIRHIIHGPTYAIKHYTVSIYNNEIRLMPGLEYITNKRMNIDQATAYIKALKGDIYIVIYCQPIK